MSDQANHKEDKDDDVCFVSLCVISLHVCIVAHHMVTVGEDDSGRFRETAVGKKRADRRSNGLKISVCAGSHACE